jgi:hypothetical protein
MTRIPRLGRVPATLQKKLGRGLLLGQIDGELRDTTIDISSRLNRKRWAISARRRSTGRAFTMRGARQHATTRASRARFGRDL